jgi:hypothetical protein
MQMGKFAAALAIGSVPTAFAFAAIGAGWADWSQAAADQMAKSSFPVAIVTLRNRTLGPVELFLARQSP